MQEGLGRSWQETICKQEGVVPMPSDFLSVGPQPVEKLHCIHSLESGYFHLKDTNIKTGNGPGYMICFVSIFNMPDLN